MGNGEVIICNCFFDFWFYFINHEKNRTKRNFSQIIKSVSVESIIDFVGYNPKVTIKVLDEWNDESCVVFSFCKSCYDSVITFVADMNKLSFEEAKKRSCSDPHEFYYFGCNIKTIWCNYCLLNCCFPRILRFTFTVLNDQCLLEKKMISELVLFPVSVFVLKKYYRKKTRVVNFNDSIIVLSKVVDIVRQKKTMNFSNNYIPKYTPPEERDFLSYLDDIKYEKFMENPYQFFKKTKIINFDIIHHQCRGDKLEKPESCYQAVFEENSKKHKKQDKNFLTSSALRNQGCNTIFFSKKKL